jgi:hypothetical protein
MSSKLFTGVVLDQPRRIRFTERSKALVSALKDPLDFPGYGNAKGRRARAALCQWLWACIDEKPNPFESWEDLAEFVTDERAPEQMKALGECIELGLPSKEAKNGDSSTQSHSPASS